MNRLLAGKTVFLTGGARGIGRECALAYAAEGAHVVVADLDLDTARRTAEELSTEGIALSCDVADASSVSRALRETITRFGRLDAIHNNAGIVGAAKPLDETSDAEWEKVHRINLKSVYLTTKHGIEHVKEQKGCILNTASLVGVIGQSSHAAYVSTKGAMISLTKAMALDYASSGVRVNAICPAGVWTPMLRDWTARQPDPGAMEAYLNEIHLLGHCPEGDVVADAAVFLISDKARFITGCILPVSGGAELGYRRSSLV